MKKPFKIALTVFLLVLAAIGVYLIAKRLKKRNPLP